MYTVKGDEVLCVDGVNYTGGKKVKIDPKDAEKYRVIRPIKVKASKSEIKKITPKAEDQKDVSTK